MSSWCQKGFGINLRGNFLTSLALQDSKDTLWERVQLFLACHTHINNLACWYTSFENTLPRRHDLCETQTGSNGICKRCQWTGGKFSGLGYAGMLVMLRFGYLHQFGLCNLIRPAKKHYLTSRIIGFMPGIGLYLIKLRSCRWWD